VSIEGGLTKAPPAKLPACPPLSGSMNVCQTMRPVRASSATMLPLNVQQTYPGFCRANAVSLDDTPM
jgi:hypothetical protein